MSDMQDFQDRGEPITSPPPGRSRVYGWKVTVVHDDDDYDEWADYCIPHCPDDVCRNSGHCAWPRHAS